MQTFRNIILTDDDEEDCFLFSEVFYSCLSDKEAHLKIKNDGVQLMDELNESVPPPPQVIFLDINMPRKNGFECLQEIRKTPKLMEIPVIIFSTSVECNIIREAFDYGANYYVTKPTSFQLLNRTIAHLLSFDHKKLSLRPDIDDFVIRIA